MDMKTFGILKKYCEKEGLKMEVPIQTNDEWLNSLPTEEKAEFYAKLTLGCYKCGAKGSHNIKNCGLDYCLCSKRDFVMWLKQPHREE